MALKFMGFDYRHLSYLVKNAAEEQLLRIRALMETKWGKESLTRLYSLGDRLSMEMSNEEIAARLMYSAVNIAILKYEGDRLHAANPVRVQNEPIALKRAVSARELLHIIECGSVMGRLNSWHMGDPRRLVLWSNAETRDGALLSQSDELSRQAIIVLCEEKGIEIKRDAVTSAEITKWINRETVKRALAIWTSAIIITRSLCGSTVWPKHNRDNLMGGIDEHGFPSGYVKSDDIVTVRLYKEKIPIFEGSFSDTVTLLEEWNSAEDSTYIPTVSAKVCQCTAVAPGFSSHP